MTTQTANQPAESHFYASSIGMWGTTSDTRTLSDLIRLFDKDKMTYSLWLVPGPHTTQYEIKWYAPQVEGAQLLETVEFKNNRRVVAKK